MVPFFFFKPRFLARTDDGARDAALRGAAAAAALDEPRREGGARRPHPLAARARQGAVLCRVASCCVAVCGRDVCVMCCAVLWCVWVVVCGRGAERILARARQGTRARARSAAATRRQHGEWNTRRARMPPCGPLEDPPPLSSGTGPLCRVSPRRSYPHVCFLTNERNHRGGVRFSPTREPPRMHTTLLTNERNHRRCTLLDDERTAEDQRFLQLYRREW